MVRSARIVIPGIAHHVTQRGNNKQAVFYDDIDRYRYCCWVNKYTRKYGLEILAYCLMKNHVHFIVVPEKEDSLYKTFHAIHLCYTRYFHGKRETSGHLWQARYYSCPMDERHLYRGIKYVEQNPVRGQMVKKPWQYRWSSAQWHIGSTNESDIDLTNIDLDLVDKKDWKAYLGDGFETVPFEDYSKRISSK